MWAVTHVPPGNRRTSFPTPGPTRRNHSIVFVHDCNQDYMPLSVPRNTSTASLRILANPLPPVVRKKLRTLPALPDPCTRARDVVTCAVPSYSDFCRFGGTPTSKSPKVVNLIKPLLITKSRPAHSSCSVSRRGSALWSCSPIGDNIAAFITCLAALHSTSTSRYFHRRPSTTIFTP